MPKCIRSLYNLPWSVAGVLSNPWGLDGTYVEACIYFLFVYMGSLSSQYGACVHMGMQGLSIYWGQKGYA